MGPLGTKITAQVYHDTIIPHLYHWKAINESCYLPSGATAVIMEDNAAIHKAKLIKDEHQKRGGTVVDWPANSPDLNPIENVWRVLKARIAKRWPRTYEEMKTVMLDEWYKLTHQDIAKYCSGEVMRERCRAVLAANGGPINW
jgi:hypothetical protein